MIGSLDKKHEKIKITSIMRDTYVDIPGKGMDKINHAYAFGGPELAIKTVNKNFNMDIRDFVAIDFSGFEKIIDIIGGIEIDVKANELPYLGVESSEKQLLNGREALAYSRIRKTGNGDYDRANRQRVVLEKIIEKTMDASIIKYPKLLDSILIYIDTSIPKVEMLKLGTYILSSNIKDVEQFRIPVDEHLKHRFINNIFYIEPITIQVI